MAVFLYPVIGAIARLAVPKVAPKVALHATSAIGGITGAKLISDAFNQPTTHQQPHNVVINGPENTTPPPRKATLSVSGGQDSRPAQHPLSTTVANLLDRPLQFIYNPVVKPGIRIDTLPMTPPGDWVKLPGLENEVPRLGQTGNEGFSIVRPNTTIEGFTSSISPQRLGGYQSLNTNTAGNYLHLSSDLDTQKLAREIESRSNSYHQSDSTVVPEAKAWRDKLLDEAAAGRIVLTENEDNYVATEAEMLVVRGESDHTKAIRYLENLTALAHEKNSEHADAIDEFTQTKVVHPNNLQKAYEILLRDPASSTSRIMNRLNINEASTSGSLSFDSQKLPDSLLMETAIEHVTDRIYQYKWDISLEMHRELESSMREGTLSDQSIDAFIGVTQKIGSEIQSSGQISDRSLQELHRIYFEAANGPTSSPYSATPLTQQMREDYFDAGLGIDPGTSQAITIGVKSLLDDRLELKELRNTLQNTLKFLLENER